MQIVWRGETWGAFGSDVQVVEAPGLEDIDATAQSSDGGGMDGSSVMPVWQKPLEFTVKLVVFADTTADMADAMDTLKAKTAPLGSDRASVWPLVYTIDGQEARTVFARVVRRSPPTAFDTSDRYQAAEVLVSFECPEPITYIAEQTSDELAVGDTVAIDCAGWVPSQRWSVTFTGPLTNPQISSNAVAGWCVRYTGVALGAGDSLTIDLAPRSVDLALTIDAVTSDPSAYMDGGSGSNRPPVWFPIVPGAQTITFDADAGAGSCVFSWREAKP